MERIEYQLNELTTAPAAWRSIEERENWGALLSSSDTPNMNQFIIIAVCFTFLIGNTSAFLLGSSGGSSCGCPTTPPSCDQCLHCQNLSYLNLRYRRCRVDVVAHHHHHHAVNQTQ
ncbi:hypothetical protein DICVIV_04333 [Dictyocaulus viviparus]|uniref:Uncharacterized protein n=1 Tax=Dictyocaulus viviparus TaxID=29172 RepID=A0A0D8XYH1_DICVI|nr:hypothetical protein DICVIV_04333 [Dictyocaulus viviparus]